RRGPRCNARNASALEACSAWFIMSSRDGDRVARSLGCETRMVKSAASGGQVRRLALACIALAIGLCAAAALLPAAEPRAVESAGLSRLTHALAAMEAKEGATSPYLLPLIEEIA